MENGDVRLYNQYLVSVHLLAVSIRLHNANVGCNSRSRGSIFCHLFRIIGTFGSECGGQSSHYDYDAKFVPDESLANTGIEKTKKKRRS